jgi:hypothetical protein
MNDKELIDFIQKKLRIKLIEIEYSKFNTRASVLRCNSINRIKELIIKYDDEIKGKYSNIDITTESITGSHTFIDFWCNNNLITIYHYDKNAV